MKANPMKAKTRRNQRKTKSVAHARKSSSHTRGKALIGKNAKKPVGTTITVKHTADKPAENQIDIEQLVKGRMIFIPATKNEVARIIIPPDVDKEIRENIHLSYFLPSHPPK
jgi:hypothetical protein